MGAATLWIEVGAQTLLLPDAGRSVMQFLLYECGVRLNSVTGRVPSRICTQTTLKACQANLGLLYGSCLAATPSMEFPWPTRHGGYARRHAPAFLGHDVVHRAAEDLAGRLARLVRSRKLRPQECRLSARRCDRHRCACGPQVMEIRRYGFVVRDYAGHKVALSGDCTLSEDLDPLEAMGRISWSG